MPRSDRPAPAGRPAADHHLLVAFDGLTVPPDVASLLADGEVPGVTLFRHANVDSADQVAALTEALQAAAGGDLPLLVAADQETGQLLGLGGDTTAFPGAMALGATGDPGLARRVAVAIGTELRALGVNLDYAPVCDVATNPANPALGVRAFSDDPRLVAAMVAATVAGLAEAGVIACAKHFPGAGEAVVDPHRELPVLDLDGERLDAVELVPFGAAVDAGVGSVMVGHYAVPAITGRADLPASIAGDVVTGLLRDRLGFDGVVVTDALDMGALPSDDDGAAGAVAAVAAGVDLLLCGPGDGIPHRLRDGLARARSGGLLDDGAASRARVDALRRWVASFPRPDRAVVDGPDHRALAREVAARAVTLVRHDGALPLPRHGRLLAVMPEPADLTPADTSSLVAPGLAPALRAHHDDVVEVVTTRDPDDATIAHVVAAARESDAVVLATTWVEPGQATLVDAVLDAVGPDVPVATVALRTPFDLAANPRAGTHLCTYDLQEHALAALADVLFGVAPPRGRLPAAIPGLHPRGHGLTSLAQRTPTPPDRTRS